MLKNVLVVLIALAALAFSLLDLAGDDKTTTAGPDQAPPTAAKTGSPSSQAVFAVLPGGERIDVGPTLARIERGEKAAHRNDGSVFGNYEGRLPKQRRGYYREYVHPTPGRRGPGARRLVLGQEGEVFYTHDHYESFVRVR